MVKAKSRKKKKKPRSRFGHPPAITPKEINDVRAAVRDRKKTWKERKKKKKKKFKSDKDANMGGQPPIGISWTELKELGRDIKRIVKKPKWNDKAHFGQPPAFFKIDDLIKRKAASPRRKDRPPITAKHILVSQKTGKEVREHRVIGPRHQLKSKTEFTMRKAPPGGTDVLEKAHKTGAKNVVTIKKKRWYLDPRAWFVKRFRYKYKIK